MTVKDLIKELKKFHPDAEVELTSCYNEECPCIDEKECDCKSCHFIAYGIVQVNSVEKNSPGEINDKHNWPCILIQDEDSWDFDENGELIKDN
jgi:hypothetical protein